jgi:hypothetical protein
MPSGSVNGSRKPISTAPEGSAATSSAFGLATRTTTAASASRLGGRRAQRCPRRTGSSGSRRGRPQPRSTTTVEPRRRRACPQLRASGPRGSRRAPTPGARTLASRRNLREGFRLRAGNQTSRGQTRRLLDRMEVCDPDLGAHAAGSARTRRPWRSDSAGTRGRSRRSGSARPSTTSAR